MSTQYSSKSSWARLGLCAGMLLAATWASAQNGQGGQGGQDRMPPPEALEACKTLKSGQDCSFKGQQSQQVKGSCWAPEGKPLACRPKDAPMDGAPPKK